MGELFCKWFKRNERSKNIPLEFGQKRIKSGKLTVPSCLKNEARVEVEIIAGTSSSIILWGSKPMVPRALCHIYVLAGEDFEVLWICSQIFWDLSSWPPPGHWGAEKDSFLHKVCRLPLSRKAGGQTYWSASALAILSKVFRGNGWTTTTPRGFWDGDCSERC